MECALEINQVTVAYGNRIAVNNITASLPRRQITAIIGPNGSGKSTLLKAAVGLIPLQKGAIRILGRPFAQARRLIAYVPQQDEVDWHYPILVWEVVALGRFQPGNIFFRPSAKDRRIIIDSLARVGMEKFILSPIGQLSGGQRQRVFLARALAQQAELYLLDEPFNGVDAKTEEVILGHIKAMKNEGKSVVLVHHKLGEVSGSFDQVLMLNRELIGFGPTELFFTEELIRLTYGAPIRKGALPAGRE